MSLEVLHLVLFPKGMMMNLEILADLKRMRDDILTLNDIVYGTHRSARNNEDLEFPIRSIQMKLGVINDIFKRIEGNWEREKNANQRS